MHGNSEENPGICYFHPKELLVGVCAVCLHERLLILASKQEHGHRLQSSGESFRRKALKGVCSSSQHKRPSVNIYKIFAFGGFLNKLRKSSNLPCEATGSSQEDSFISIRLEGDGVASWEDVSFPRVCSDQSFQPSNLKTDNGSGKETKQIRGLGHDEITHHNRTVIERLRPLHRWRKRTGYVLQLMRWSRTNKSGSCHISSKVDRIKSQSKRRSIE